MTNEIKETENNNKKTRTRKQNRTKAVQKTTSTDENRQGVQQDQLEINLTEEPDISAYISNPDGHVYAISNLPEEFIATLFAWVSRSPKSFKEHLKQAIQEFEITKPLNNPYHGLSQKAKDFHEKWTVGYGHSCYDEETDVLTKQGFKRWSEVTEEDELASVDPDSLEIEYQRPVRLIAEPYKGKMYKVNRNRLDMLVTPNHKLFAWPRHKIEGFETRKYQLIQAQDLKNKCYKVKLGGLHWNGDMSDTMFGYPIEPLLQLYGFFIGDGHIEPRMKHAIQFHIKKQRKIDYLYSLCDQLGLTISVNENNKYYITSPDKYSIGEIMSDCYDQNREKQIPQGLFDLDSSLLEYLYDGLLNSDGSIGKSGEVYDTSSFVLANQVQHLCVLLGWTSSMSLLHPSEEHGRHKDGWRVFVNKKLLESMVNKVQYDTFDEWIDYDGIVYCAELEKYHTLIVRRNGRIHVSGNSVAEHAIAHVGIEEVSRLASAELELSNTFLSITEYSQRYQKPQRGKWHNPFSAISVGQPLDQPTFHEKLEEFYNECFDVFERLITGVYNHLWYKATDGGNLAISKQEENALQKLAFEDARYVLPLAMHTQLGMTANGRAWRDGLAKLGTSKHAESQKLAENIKEEVTKVLPVLLRHAHPSQYQLNSVKRIKDILCTPNTKNVQIPEKVRLHATVSEKFAIEEVIIALIMEYESLSRNQASVKAMTMTESKKEEIVTALLHEMAFFDSAPDVLKHITYNATVVVSEANWHQLLRHNRKTQFTATAPSPFLGITIPPRITAAGFQHLVKDIAEKSKELYTKLVDDGFESEAEYVVLNAHRRQVHMTFDLQEAYHLINLRTSEEAQWDIRETFTDLYAQLSKVHPLLFSKAKRRQ